MSSSTRPRTMSLMALVAAILTIIFLSVTAQAQETEPAIPVSVDQTHVVSLPIINLPSPNPSVVTIRGQLLVNGKPLPHVPFMIGGCEDDTHAERGKTDALGFYTLNMPRDPKAKEVSVSLSYPATRTVPYTGTIGMYRSICTTSVNGRVTLPTIELGGIEFNAPRKGETVAMPFELVWSDRLVPAEDEVYQVAGTIEYDCVTCDPIAYTSAEIAGSSTGATNRIEFECIEGSQALMDVRSAEFRILVSNATGTGSSEPRYIGISNTIHCAG